MNDNQLPSPGAGVQNTRLKKSFSAVASAILVALTSQVASLIECQQGGIQLGSQGGVERHAQHILRGSYVLRCERQVAGWHLQYACVHAMHDVGTSSDMTLCSGRSHEPHGCEAQQTLRVSHHSGLSCSCVTHSCISPPGALGSAACHTHV